MGKKLRRAKQQNRTASEVGEDCGVSARTYSMMQAILRRLGHQSSVHSLKSVYPLCNHYYGAENERCVFTLATKGVGHLVHKGTGGRSSINGVVAIVFGATSFLGCYVVQQLVKWRKRRAQVPQAMHAVQSTGMRMYPPSIEEAIAEACPFCCGNCNCKASLRLDGPLKHENEEQRLEKKLEAKLRGLSLSELKVQKADVDEDERA